ncbi:MAG: hypothetical protein RI907_932 [Pseudomonadota bacterium]|jgi:hypothetical protein
MAISSAQLQQAAQILSAAANVRAAAGEIRPLLAPLRTLVLDAFDMRAEQPVMRLPQDRAIYLMATDGHCWNVTSEPEHATALVLTGA